MNEKYPDKWIPAYSLVTFSPHLRYSEALQKGRQQEAIMQDVMQISNIENKWEGEEDRKYNTCPVKRLTNQNFSH